LDWICSFMHTPACLKNSATRRLRTYTLHVPACFCRRGGRRGSLSETHIKIFWTILTLLVCMVPACSPAPPSGGGLGRRTAERAGCCPPQVGVLGGVRPSAPAATPSSGSILSGTSLKPFQRSNLGTYPKFLQGSQQLVWWKLPSSTYMSREVHPVNILTPPHSTLAVCWISARQPIIFFLCLSKSASSSGFVNMSAICSPVATWYMLTVPLLTSSLK
jgi:hypothetical protein